MRLNDVITSGSFIQSTINRMPQQGTDYPSTNHGNFQVLVQEGNNLVHYWHDNTQDLNAYWPSQPPSSPNGRPSEGWQRAQTITSKATGPGCIIQSDFRHGNCKDGNFEAVVLEGNDLVHYWLDTSNPGTQWQRAQTITSKATGPGCIIQDSQGAFQVIALERNTLTHYWRKNNTTPPGLWTYASVITNKATGPGCIIESLYKKNSSLSIGNFEVVVQEGNNLVHWYLENTNSPQLNSNVTWNYGTTITAAAKGPGCIIQTDFRSIDLLRPRGNDCNKFAGDYKYNSFYSFDVIVEERLNSVRHYWLLKPGFWWNRTFHPIRSDKGYHPPTNARKIVQLTGNIDRSTGLPTPNRTGANGKPYKVYGSDLGSSFLYKGKLYFLFGDTRTHPTQCPRDPDGQPDHDDLLDVIAYTTDSKPNDQTGIKLEFIGHPKVANICQDGSEVPVEGISINNKMYVFFATKAKT